MTADEAEEYAELADKYNTEKRLLSQRLQSHRGDAVMDESKVQAEEDAENAEDPEAPDAEPGAASSSPTLADLSDHAMECEPI